MKALWRRARRPFLLTSVATLLVLVPLLAPGGAAGAPARGTGSVNLSVLPVFGPETIVDPQRVAGEPSVSVDSNGVIYVAAPFGFSTSASFVWRSTDRGKTFHLVPGNEPPEGKPTTCAGGGDSGLALDTANRLYFVDLQGLTDVSNSVSSDQGATWNTTCNAANANGVDRPWIATYGDPLAENNAGAMYQTVDEIGQCTISCGLGQVGNNIVEITRSQDGTNFLPVPGQQVEVDGIVSGIVTDPNSGDVYLAHTGLTDADGNLVSGGDANGNSNAVVVVRFPDGFFPGPVPTPLLPGETLCQTSPSTCTTDVVYAGPLDGSGNSTINVGVDFAPIAVDQAGNLYAVWTEAPVDPSTGLQNGPSPIYLSISTDQGATWSAPIDVSANAPSLQTNLFPWVAAGSSGRIDIVWYGSPEVGNCPDQPCGPTATGKWQVMMAQSLNAVAPGHPTPTFSVSQVAEISNHDGTVCTFGIACTTDRGLLDFLSVTPGPNGEADVVWADATNQNFSGGTSAALIAFSRQLEGSSLYASVGQLHGALPPTGIGKGSKDAYYSANGTTVPASDNLTLQGARVTRQDADTYRIKIRVNDLSSLAVDPSLGGTDAVWLVRWEIPDPTGAGHTFFAAMESDGGGAPTFFDGETSSIDTTHAKFLTYPPGNTIQGFYKPGPPGRIVLYVPVADVGGTLSTTLYSITGISATQSEPSSSNTILNVIDQTAPFDATP